MSNEIAIQTEQGMALSVDAVVRQREKIKEIMNRVMQSGVDYGTIPGCPKPSLYKPGAEKLCSTFMLAFSPIVEDLSTATEKRYRVTGRLTHQATGIFMGENVGEASTAEEKYAWRKAICEEEFNAAEPECRRIKYGKDKNGSVYTIQQVRTNPADLANTVLKMAAKRAHVAVTLVTLGASDFFTQDIEDMPAEYLNQGKAEAKPKPSMPKTRPVAGENAKVLCKVSRAFERKSDKAPFIFGIATPDGGRIDGYFQTRDENMVAAMERHISEKDVIELSYHAEVNGKYTNLVIDEIAAVADATPNPLEDESENDRNAD